MPVSQIWISLFGVSKVPITSTVWCVNNGIVILQFCFWNCHFGLNIISKVCTVNQLVMFSLALNLQINWLWWIQSYCENSVCYWSVQEKFVLLQCQGHRFHRYSHWGTQEYEHTIWLYFIVSLKDLSILLIALSTFIFIISEKSCRCKNRSLWCHI